VKLHRVFTEIISRSSEMLTKLNKMPLFLLDGDGGGGGGQSSEADESNAGEKPEDKKEEKKELKPLTREELEELLKPVATAVDSVKAETAKSIQELTKKYNSELADRRREVKSLEEQVGKWTDKAPNQLETELQRERENVRKLTIQNHVEREAVKQGYLKPEDSLRFVSPELLKDAFDDKGEIKKDVIENALKETAHTYPALVNQKEAPNLEARNQTTKTESDKAKDQEIRSRLLPSN
jgi:hypothetical protein